MSTVTKFAGTVGGSGSGAATGTATPQPLGTAAAGAASAASREDHVHQMPTTDSVTEGSTNLYSTAARVRAAVLTGFSTASSAAVSATDTVLSAIGKLAAQIALKAGIAQTIEDVTGTTYTYVEADNGKTKNFTNAAGCSASTATGLSAGWWCKNIQASGAGTLTLVQGASTALSSKSGSLVSAGVKSQVMLEQTAANVFLASGDLGAIGASDIYSAGLALLAAGSNITLTGDGTAITVASSASSGAAQYHDGTSFAMYPQYDGTDTWSSTHTLQALQEGTAAGESGSIAGMSSAPSRIKQSGTAGSQNSAGIRTQVNVGAFPGSGAGEPVLALSTSWSTRDTIAWSGSVGGKFFAGWRSSGGAIGNNAISTIRDGFGVGLDEGQRYYRLISANASAQYQEALGTNVEGNPNGNNWHWLGLLFYPGSGDNRKVNWQFYDRVNNVLQTGTATATSTGSKLPTAGADVNAHVHRNTGTGVANTVLAASVSVLGVWGGRLSGL